jgi:class 3 adenylate cyclase
MFADIAGFTAWSSTRDPQQVFCLLEAVYGAFDVLADRRKVFKVETIGDSYVAVCGLPKPRPNHAIVMCKFARECREKFDLLTRELEKELGPDTADLMLRFGLNSGPVTAGVLRGQKSRFQLFGDTVNTAARMESNGIPGRIQASQSTVDYLLTAGKTTWVRARKDKVTAKGKGEMQTYWIEPRTHTPSVASGVSASSGGGTSEGDAVLDYLDERTERLIDWNTDVLAGLIRQIVAARQQTNSNKKAKVRRSTYEGPSNDLIAMDEFQEAIELPAFDPMAHRNTVDPDSITLDPQVMEELRDLVIAIGSSYLPNSFHNFEHCSHVTMSVVKLLGRIVSPTDVSVDTSKVSAAEQREKVARSIYDRTYGITSHPMTQFACIFSALIHDVGHTGVPNAILAKESPEVADKYRNQSLAEQKSVDIAWDLLMEDDYKNLRECIFATKADMDLFRKLVVNSVLATDIFDKELGQLRKSRWEKAFAVQTSSNHSEIDINRKATIVIEHVIQASDVAHTMQHWHIYQRWNQRLFNEMYQAFHDRRTETDPSLGWYKGELWFFDNYVIPLSKKLKECGVFGVSSDEYLSYALQNRKEWERKGESIVQAMVDQFGRSTPPDTLDTLDLDEVP